MMQFLWRSHAPDEERVIREYAAREEAGEIARDSVGTPDAARASYGAPVRLGRRPSALPVSSLRARR